MAKKKVTSNIQENHTLGEYQRYFSHLLGKGKLNRYSLKEKKKLDPEKQYWKITDEKGDTYYYEVPKYIKPDSTKSAYSMNRVMHRRPARAAIAIFVGTAVLSFTSALVTKHIFASDFPPVPPQPEPEPEEMFKALHDFQKWHEENPKGDATKKYSVSELASIGMTATLYDAEKYEAGEYPRRPLLCVGYGNTFTNARIMTVYVDISNAFIYQDGDALEESISYSEQFLAPKVGRRDFYTISDNKVNSNEGEASSSTEIKWKNEFDRKYETKDAYIEVAGKIPDNPFLYSIDSETVLADSSATKTNDGYQLNINLDTVKGVARYVKRIKYLSGKSATKFYNVNITITTDDNLRLKSFGVDEKYVIEDQILGLLDTTGALTTKYYYDDVPNIPDIDEKFEYSKYPK